MGDTAEHITVPMEVEWKNSWLTWITSVTGCLNALGEDCDLVDVAGETGYAFHLGIHPDLCQSGPFVCDWDALCRGVRSLGRATELYHAGEFHNRKTINDRTREQCRMAFELARREIQAGRPCVILGAYIAEFAICIGVVGDSYIVKSYKEHWGGEQTPVKYDETDCPAGAYTLAFPAPVHFRLRMRDRDAIVNAAKFFNHRSYPYRYGAEGYDLWMQSLMAKRAGAFGNAFNAQCYAELKGFARDYVAGLAERNQLCTDELEKAAVEYAKTADAMKRVAQIFPSIDWTDAKVEDERAINDAVEALKVAKTSEVKAIEYLEQAAVADWPMIGP
jgi:hypothetical protein